MVPEGAVSCTGPPKKHHVLLIYNSVFDDIGYSYLHVRLDPSVTSDPTLLGALQKPRASPQKARVARGKLAVNRKKPRAKPGSDREGSSC